MTIFEQDSIFSATEDGPTSIVRSSIPAVTALETAFPAGIVSAAAERESWRKEVHRPATHTHKWWAQRLGSVFRGILAAAVAQDEQDAIECYSNALRLEGLIVCDPFAGSGTTLAEAAKLGARVIGRDINPVATLVQRQALAPWDRTRLDRAFKQVESQVRSEIDQLHRDERGRPVLYYFWVALAQCPQCPPDVPPVELFSRYVFARHAYPKKYPASKATCPHCHAIAIVDVVKDKQLTCPACNQVSDLVGPVNRATMTCSQGHAAKVIDALGGSLRSSACMRNKCLMQTDHGCTNPSTTSTSRFTRRLRSCLRSEARSSYCQPAHWMTAITPDRPSAGTIASGVSSSTLVSSIALGCLARLSATLNPDRSARRWPHFSLACLNSTISSARSRVKGLVPSGTCSPTMS